MNLPRLASTFHNDTSEWLLCYQPQLYISITIWLVVYVIRITIMRVQLSNIVDIVVTAYIGFGFAVENKA